MNREWYVIISGRQMGPISSDKVQGLINNGAFKSNDMLWCAGMTNWQTLRELAKFAESQKPKAVIRKQNPKPQTFSRIYRQAQISNSNPNPVPQGSPTPSTKAIALAVISVFALTFTISAYWFTNEISGVNVELTEAKSTINNYKSEMDKITLRIDKTDALFNHLQTLFAEANEQFKSANDAMVSEVGELKSAVVSDNARKFATKEDVSDIKTAVGYFQEEQKSIGEKFKGIESALDTLAERLLDMKSILSENAKTPPSKSVAIQTQDNISAEEHFTNGNKKYASGDYKGAIDDYSKAINLNSYYATSFGKLGETKETSNISK